MESWRQQHLGYDTTATLQYPSVRPSVRGSALAHSSSNPIILSLKGLTTDPATPRRGAGEGGTEPGAPKRGARGGGWDDAAVATDDGEGEEGRGRMANTRQ